MLISVGIRERLLESADDGRSWTEGVRIVPPPTDPQVRGAHEGLRPAVPNGCLLTHVQIGPGGNGLAAASETARGDLGHRSTAKLWLTRDGGASWQSIQPPDIGFWGRLRAGSGWPPEEIDSVTVLAGGVLAFAWEDPWLHENSHCHLLLSADGGVAWRYSRLPDGCVNLAWGPGPLRVFGLGQVAVWSGSGSFRREPTRLDWGVPPGYFGSGGIYPRPFAQFRSETEGLALVVRWPKDDPPRRPEELPPPLVGLARTRDGGRLWKIEQIWEGPRAADLNRRHVFTLDLR